MNFRFIAYQKVYCGRSWRSVFTYYWILDIADMTAEGALPLGAAVTSSQIQAGRLATLLLSQGWSGSDCFWDSPYKNEIPALLDVGLSLWPVSTLSILKSWGEYSNPLYWRCQYHFQSVMKLGLSNTAVFLISISCLIIVCILLTLLMKTQLGLVCAWTGDTNEEANDSQCR